MKKSDVFFSEGIFEHVMLTILYLAGIFFLGTAIYAITLMF